MTRPVICSLVCALGLVTRSPIETLFLGSFSSKLQSLPQPYIFLPTIVFFPLPAPLTQRYTLKSIAHNMATRKRKQDEEEELQALPSDESEEEEE